ncbi:MAG: serine/threonine-protein kinase [Pseudomonadota bacterium]
MTEHNDVDILALLEVAYSSPEEERETSLIEAGADADTVAKVLAMIERDDTASAFLSRTQNQQLAGFEMGRLLTTQWPEDTEQIEEAFGPYEIVRLLGAGGMGRVFLTQQTQPIERTVALKVIKRHVRLTEAMRHRFAQEQQALARLSHPNIAQIHEVGTTDDDVPYFVMEYVDGERITQFCDERLYSIKQRLALFKQVCLAVNYAHQKRLLHLDLKPSNILVSSIDGAPVPKIIDFGIALQLDREAEVKADTQVGMGTPNYTAPEMLDPERDALALDTRADAYSLGVLLYELISGCLPRTITRGSPEQMLGQLRKAAILPPSDRLAQETSQLTDRASARNTGARRLRNSLSGDLDAICLKALSLDREDRYGGALELGLDIQRVIDGKLVRARDWTTAYRLQKFARRNWVPISLTTGVVAVLLGAVVSVNAALQESIASEQKATQVALFLEDLLKLNDPYDARKRAPGGTGRVLVNELMLEGASRAETQLGDQPEVQASVLHTIGNVLRAFPDPDEPVPVLERAVELRIQELGERHPDTHASQRQLGLAYERQGRYEEAEAQLAASYAGFLEALGADAFETVEVQVDLAKIRFTQGEKDPKSTADLKDALAAAEKTDIGILILADLYNTLGWDAHYKDQPEEAVAYLSRALELYEGYFPEIHASTALMRHNLATVSIPAGQIDEAEKLAESAISILSRTTEPQYWRNANARGLLGTIRMKQGRYEEAEELMLDGLKGIVAGTGPDTVYAQAMRKEIVTLYETLGRDEEAARYRAQGIR